MKHKNQYPYPVRPLRFPLGARLVLQAFITLSIYTIIVWVVLTRQISLERQTNQVNAAIERAALATQSFDVERLEMLPLSMEPRAQSKVMEDFKNYTWLSETNPLSKSNDLSILVKRDGNWVHYLSTDPEWVGTEWEFGQFREKLEPSMVFGNFMQTDDDFQNQLVSTDQIQRLRKSDEEYYFLQFQIGHMISPDFSLRARTEGYDFSDARIVFITKETDENPLLLSQMWFVGKNLLFTFLIILPFIAFVAYRLTGRARSIRETIGRIALGDYHARASIGGKDEVGQLSDHINGLAVALEERQKLKSEVNIASQLQRDLLPAIPPCPIEVGYDIAQANKMSNRVGGDFFDYQCDGTTLWVAVGDISGHGLESGLMMAASRTAFRMCLEADVKPNDIIEKLNNRLSEDLSNGHFLTLAILGLNLKSGKWWHISAGHEPTLVRENGKVRMLNTTGPPLGMFPNMSYKKAPETGVLDHDDIILMSTDGIREASNESDEGLGQGPMREELVKAQTSQELADNLVRRMKEHLNGLSNEDDVTLVAIRRP